MWVTSVRAAAKLFLVHQPALQHQLTKVDEFALLILDRLVEVGRGDLSPFTQHLAESLSLHRLQSPKLDNGTRNIERSSASAATN